MADEESSVSESRPQSVKPVRGLSNLCRDKTVTAPFTLEINFEIYVN